MFVKLNERVYLNLDKITRIKIDEVQDGIRIRFYELNEQVAKSKRFNNLKDAQEWLNRLLKKDS
jgi:hypothetical protein